MTTLVTAHTADLGPATLAAARDLLFEVFDDMTDADWDHCLGGVHALAYEGSTLVGHASVMQRRLIHRGVALRAGYIEGVVVRESARRRGHAATMMTALERVIRVAYDLGALGASDEGVPFYLGRGWQVWRGPLAALTPDGIVPTPEEDGAIFVLPAGTPLDLDGDLTCGWRAGDVW